MALTNRLNHELCSWSSGPLSLSRHLEADEVASIYTSSLLTWQRAVSRRSTAFCLNCVISPFLFLCECLVLCTRKLISMYISYIMLHDLAKSYCYNCVLLCVSCILYKKPRSIRKYNWFSLFINIFSNSVYKVEITM